MATILGINLGQSRTFCRLSHYSIVSWPLGSQVTRGRAIALGYTELSARPHHNLS